MSWQKRILLTAVAAAYLAMPYFQDWWTGGVPVGPCGECWFLNAVSRSFMGSLIEAAGMMFVLPAFIVVIPVAVGLDAVGSPITWANVIGASLLVAPFAWTMLFWSWKKWNARRLRKARKDGGPFLAETGEVQKLPEVKPD